MKKRNRTFSPTNDPDSLIINMASSSDTAQTIAESVRSSHPKRKQAPKRAASSESGVLQKLEASPSNSGSAAPVEETDSAKHLRPKSKRRVKTTSQMMVTPCNLPAMSSESLVPVPKFGTIDDAIPIGPTQRWKQSIAKIASGVGTGFFSSAKCACSWLGRSVKLRPAHSRMHVRETVPLGDKRIVALLEVDGQGFLIGAAHDSISVLATLENRSPNFRSVLEAQKENH